MATIKDLKRMCDSYEECSECPMGDTCCGDSISALPDNADEIVDKWVEEHPIKTYAMDFLEKFPNAPKVRNGTPLACWKHVYGNGNDCGPNDCIECWNQEIKTE